MSPMGRGPRWWFCPAVVCAALFGVPSASSADDAGVTRAPVFVSGRDGYHTFRIPAVVRSSRGVLLVFCEGRKDGSSDTGDIDVVLRRSLDEGKTWGALQVVADDGAHTIGNPCPVVDGATGTVWLLLTRNHGKDHQRQIEAGTSREPRTVWACHSTDDGKTWSRPADVSRTTRRADWGWYGTGPCNGIQLRDGRLVVPCHHTPRQSHVQHSHVIYSDDGGKSWKLGGVAGPNTGESTVAELADSSLLMSIRSHPRLTGRRATTVSKDGGLTWSELALDKTLIDPGCQGSILHLTARPAARNRLLFSNPASTKRERLTVRLSDDGGRTWPVGKVLHPGPAGYSCLVALGDQRIGCLYERGDQRPYGTVAFACFGLEWLTGGKDRGDQRHPAETAKAAGP